MRHVAMVGTAQGLQRHSAGGHRRRSRSARGSGWGPSRASTSGFRGLSYHTRGEVWKNHAAWAPRAGSGGAGSEHQRRLYLQPLAREAPLPREHRTSSTVGLLVEMAMPIAPPDLTPNAGRFSGGGRTTSDSCPGHRAPRQRCPPVRCNPWLGGRFYGQYRPSKNEYGATPLIENHVTNGKGEHFFIPRGMGHRRVCRTPIG